MKYLNRLKSEKGLPSVPTKPTKAWAQHREELTKPTKAPFVSNVSTEERCFPEKAPLPFFEADGSLVIPFGCDGLYFWWAGVGGQSVKDTVEEVKKWVH